ncbi:hypothetical protein B0H19DRAFT_521276 [Mycena capillaripes]|nr:hypothetical protein B0H19DRAFT_521276 [Mycena capillaripes]
MGTPDSVDASEFQIRVMEMDPTEFFIPAISPTTFDPETLARTRRAESTSPLVKDPIDLSPPALRWNMNAPMPGLSPNAFGLGERFGLAGVEDSGLFHKLDNTNWDKRSPPPPMQERVGAGFSSVRGNSGGGLALPQEVRLLFQPKSICTHLKSHPSASLHIARTSLLVDLSPRPSSMILIKLRQSLIPQTSLRGPVAAPKRQSVFLIRGGAR